jgi:hypothetical protein
MDGDAGSALGLRLGLGKFRLGKRGLRGGFSIAVVEHFGKQDAVGALLAIDKVGFERGSFGRRQGMVQVAVRQRMLLDITVVH